MIITCIFCHKNKNIPPSKVARGQKYCGNACRINHLRVDKSLHPMFGVRLGTALMCPNCGKSNVFRPSEIKLNRRFCNNFCRINFIRNNPQYSSNFKRNIKHNNCPICSKLLHLGNKYCSMKCYSIYKKEARKGYGNSFFNKHHTIEAKLKIKNKAIERLKNHRFSFTPSSVFIYKDIKMRSSWETKYAEWLDKKGFTWSYEPKTFFLERSKLFYIPDFFVKEFNSYVEIKGYMRGNSKTKIDEFKQTNNLLIIERKQMQEMKLI